MALSSHHCLLFCATEIFCGTYQGDITCFIVLPEVDLGERPGGPPPPPLTLFWVKIKKESQKEEKPAGQATSNRVPPLAQGLDPLLITTMVNLFSTKS